MLSASRRARSRAGVSLLLRAGCEQLNERGLADLAGEVTNEVERILGRLVARVIAKLNILARQYEQHASSRTEP